MNAFCYRTVRHFYLTKPYANPGHDGRSKHNTFKSTKVFPVGTQVEAIDTVHYEAATGFEYGPTVTNYKILGEDVPARQLACEHDPRTSEPARTIDDACGRIRFSPAVDTVCELAVRQLIAEGKLSIADIVAAYDRSPSE